jgi:orotidine-5'-phosphate decarboxylase
MPKIIQFTEKEELARKKVCLPLDGLENPDRVLQRVKELKPVVGMFKIGKELFTRFGPDMVSMLINDYEIEICLDLKYHDIPNTVLGAAKAASELGVSMFNVHASGGLKMMEAAKEGAGQSKVLGVTILTSIDQKIMNEELRISGDVKEQVLHLAKLSCQAGLDGIVCSAADLNFIKKSLPDDFMYVTPGIKGPNTSAGEDQKRVATPGNAIQDGASILVIGRAITAATDRLEAGYEVLKDMAKYL